MRRKTVQVRDALSARQAFLANKVVIRLFLGCAAQGLRIVVLARDSHFDRATTVDRAGHNLVARTGTH
jgi:hypothetical protein